jgi:hypothetical protein
MRLSSDAPYAALRFVIYSVIYSEKDVAEDELH